MYYIVYNVSAVRKRKKENRKIENIMEMRLLQALASCMIKRKKEHTCLFNKKNRAGIS